MQIYINTKKVKRMSLVSKVLLFGGLGLMGLGLYLNIQNPEQNLQLVIIMAIIGIVMFQIAMPMQTRWSREPRMDQILNESSKGLDQRYSFFHYLLGVDHALITPAGIFAVVPNLEQGDIRLDEQGNWSIERKKSGLLRRNSGPKPLKVDSHLEHDVERLNWRLMKDIADFDNLSVKPFLVFVNPDTVVHAEDSSYPVSHIKKFKAELRKLPNAATLERSQVDELLEELKLS